MGQWWIGDLPTGIGQKVRANPTFSGQTMIPSLCYGPNAAAGGTAGGAVAFQPAVAASMMPASVAS